MTQPSEEEVLRTRVYQGLQKHKKCGLCEQTFYVDDLPGAITYKSILDLREKWRHDNAGEESNNTKAAAEDEDDQPRETEKKKKRKGNFVQRLYEVRYSPGVDPNKPQPSRLYKRIELCIFCMQFFDVDGFTADFGGESAAGTSNVQGNSNSAINRPTLRQKA